jgi:hypothetical protein
MSKPDYDIKQIKVGDEVIYHDRYAEEGSSTWRVISKLDKTLIVIEKIEKGVTEKRMIDASDVERLIVK